MDYTDTDLKNRICCEPAPVLPGLRAPAHAPFRVSMLREEVSVVSRAGLARVEGTGAYNNQLSMPKMKSPC